MIEHINPNQVPPEMDMTYISLVLATINIRPLKRLDDPDKALTIRKQKEAHLRIAKAIVESEIPVTKELMDWWGENLFGILNNVNLERFISQDSPILKQALQIFFNFDLTEGWSTFEDNIGKRLSSYEWNSAEAHMARSQLRAFRKVKGYISEI
ncbi:MAG: hypothetical protein ABIM99_06380 [Candidatus Dojkabacteria bacterium]